MPPHVAVPGDGDLFAHPITQTHGFLLPPLLAGVLAGLLVFSVALVLRERAGASPPPSERWSWAGRLSRPRVVARCVALGVLVLAVGAGRFGADDQLENIAPALVVGLLWPALVLVSALVGSVWPWVDPWDSLARLLSGREREAEPADHVWPSVAVAAGLVWYLSVYPYSLDPRAVGAVLALYTIVVLAGCLAFGRVRWLSSGEPVGLVLTWTALLPRRGLAAWQPPRGAEALVGVLAGGLMFGLVRRSVLWGGLGTWQYPTVVATVGLMVSCAVVAGLLVVARRLARGSSGALGVARAAVPALAGLSVAVAMARNRLTTSAQLIPGLVGDPFGLGWDLFGSPTAPTLLGTTLLLVVQLTVLMVGCLAGAVVLARGLPAQFRPAGSVALSLLTAAAVTIVVAH